MCHLGMRHADVHTHRLRMGRKGNKEIQPDERRNAQQKKSAILLIESGLFLEELPSIKWTFCKTRNSGGRPHGLIQTQLERT